MSVATPNHTHFEIAKAFAEAGFNVMCDKPLTFDLAQAEELAKVVAKSGVVFGVTHNYTGYPLVRQARDMVLGGELGEINAVRAFYIQGSLRTKLESCRPGARPIKRTDPKRPKRCRLLWRHRHPCLQPGPLRHWLDSRTNLLLAEGLCRRPGARRLRHRDHSLRQRSRSGTVTASQITHGRENDIWVEVDGTKASLEWHQEEPNKMIYRVNDKPHQIYTRPAGRTSARCAPTVRIPAGHPEAFLEAFANVYTAAFNDMVKRSAGQKFDGQTSLYPNVADGVDGMNFITQCVASSQEGGAWKTLKHPLCRR